MARYIDQQGQTRQTSKALDVGVDLPPEITQNLRMIGSRTLRNATRNSLAKAARHILSVARKTEPFPVYSGILRRSLGVKNSKHTSKNIYTLVGARRGFEGPRQKLSTILKQKKDAKRRGVAYSPSTNEKSKPTRYLHLVENGFRHWRSGQMIPGKKFLARAKQSSKTAVAQIIREKLSEKLTRPTTPSEITTT